jgi:hypothetical protein
MPTCAHPATARNRTDQPTCDAHRLVVVSGSWVDDGNTTEGGHG